MQQSSELRELIAGYFRSFTVGDPGWVERHVLKGAELRLIGTNPDEWMQGVDAFMLFRQEAAAATGRLVAEVSDVEAFSQGETGWGAGRVCFTTGGGQVARARFSVVFVLIDDVWRLVSSHTSIPMPDDDAFSAE